MEKPYPLRLEKAPIIEAIVEIRFVSTLPEDAVFGIVYAALKDIYPSPKQMPIMQLPSNIRIKDVNLMYQPQYQLTGENPFIIGVGPKVISISYAKHHGQNVVTYPGWTNYMADEASRIIQLLFNVLSDVKIERLGIRYQDFFEGVNIVDGMEPKFIFQGRELANLMIKTAINEDEMIHNLTISNSSSINIHTKTGINIKSGSMVDIDTVISSFNAVDIRNVDMHSIKKLLTHVHDANKNLFYETLKKEFVDILDPKYEDEKN